MSEARRALGRGLDSLLPGPPSAHIPQPAAVAAVAPRDGMRELPIDALERNPYQTRGRYDEISLAELAASISSNGVLQPIVVRALDTGRYQIIAGERRWLASQRAGKTTIPAVIRQVSNQQALELTIVENLQREDLNAMDHARAFERLSSEFGLTQEQMAHRTGKDRTSVANYLRLLKLPVLVQAEVEAGRLSFGHARALLPLRDAEAIERLALRVAEQGLSVRQTEALVAAADQPAEKKEKTERVVDPNVRQAERELQQALGCKVEITDRKGKGKIVIQYGSLEDFDRVVAALGGR